METLWLCSFLQPIPTFAAKARLPTSLDTLPNHLCVQPRIMSDRIVFERYFDICWFWCSSHCCRFNSGRHSKKNTYQDSNAQGCWWVCMAMRYDRNKSWSVESLWMRGKQHWMPKKSQTDKTSCRIYISCSSYCRLFSGLPLHKC